MNNILQPINSATADILLVLNAYASFLKAREMVRSFKAETKDDSLIIKELVKNEEKDYYSPSYGEYGVTSGIAQGTVLKINKTVDEVFNSQFMKLVESKVSSEKYYKKLKHQFVEKYPNLKEEMESYLLAHREHLHSTMMKNHQAKVKIINLSERFIAFLQISSGSADGAHLAYYPFFKEMLDKYNKDYDKERFSTLSDKYDPYGRRKSDSKWRMEIFDIMFLDDLIESVLMKVTEDDIDGSKYVNMDNENAEEKVEIAENILRQKIQRFKNLHLECKALRMEADKLF